MVAIVTLSVLFALGVIGLIFFLVSRSDTQARAVLIQEKRRTGLAYAQADPEYYNRIRATHTSRRVPQHVE